MTTSNSLSTMRVLVCEDNTIWATYFPADGYEDEQGRMEFEVCRTLSELVASAGDGFDVILIDDGIPRASGDEADFNAVRAISELTVRYGRRDKPAKMLWTQLPDANRIYTFMSFGGQHFLDKRGQTQGAGDLYTSIRAVAGGAKWAESHRALDSKSDERRIRRWRRLISLLEAGFRAEDIARSLDTTAAVITTTTGDIAHSLGIERGDGAFTTLVPQFAKRAGYCWVPYEYWGIAPDKELWLDELAPIRHERD